MDILKDLNLAQRKAVTFGTGPLLILAGAGSGKTRVLTYRIAHLIKNLNVSPYNILAVTFTNKAAEEMRKRIEKLLGHGAERLWMSTFHSISARILRREIHRLGFTDRFTIYDTYDQGVLIKRMMTKLNIDPKDIKVQAVLAEISRQKSLLKTPEAFSRRVGDFFQEAVLDIYIEYQKELFKANALDFDDLIMKAVELWVRFPEVLHFYKERFQYILVDEYQDVNRAQYRWINLLAGQDGNLCVVGDPDQGIYGFRGADIQNILSFERDYPNAHVVFLEENYRSRENILKAAQALIEKNVDRKKKKLWSRRGQGEPVVVKELIDEKEEALFILREVRTLLSDFSLEEIAVLYRTNAQSRALEEHLVRSAIPYKIVGGLRFYERKEIKDVLAYLRIMANPQDSVSLQRIINVPKRGIGRTSWETLMAKALAEGRDIYSLLAYPDELDLPNRQKAQITAFYNMVETIRCKVEECSVARLVDEILAATGYLKELEEEGTIDAQSRLENIQELFNVLKKIDEPGIAGLESFLEEVALVSDIDGFNRDEKGLTLMTLHSAKGLEFPVIFLVGMEEGFCPHSLSETPEEIEEERRLCYVGMTRAQERLYMTWASSRQIFGQLMFRKPSPFLASIPTTVIASPKNKKKEKFMKTMAMAFDKGTSEGPPKISSDGYFLGGKVRHPQWGIGTIVGKTGRDKDLTLTLAFDGIGLKDIIVEYVDLEIL